jgi:hypothetical protein
MRPATITQGTTTKWSETYTDYPASSWGLLYKLIGSSSLSITGSADGDTFDMTIPAVSSSLLPPGFYVLQGLVTSGSEVYSLPTQTIKVERNYALLSSYEVRSQARRTYDAICATLEGRASKDEQSISIAGRSLSRMAISELLQLKSHYSYMVQLEESAERVANGMSSGLNILVRFK